MNEAGRLFDMSSYSIVKSNENVFIFAGEQLKEILKNLWHAKEEDFPPLR